MATILTTKGLLDEAVLVKTEGMLDNDNEHTTWQEWRLDGELVKREVQVRLKKPAVFADGAVSSF